MRSVRHKLSNLIQQYVSLSKPEVIVAVFGVIIAGLLFVNPQHVNLPDLCIVKRIAGHCPACGSTRALVYFFKGRFADSLSYNFNIILVGPLIIFIFLKNLIKVIKTKFFI